MKFSVLAGALAFLAACSANAQGQPQQIPCDTNKINIKLSDPACAQMPDTQLMLGGIPGTGRMMKGPVRIYGEFEGGRMEAFVQVTDDPNVGIHPGREADVPGVVENLTQSFRVGALSPLRTVGNAWAINFRTAQADCFWYDNFGPAQGIGYAWEVWGIFCRPGLRGGFSDDEIKKTLLLVTPK